MSDDNAKIQAEVRAAIGMVAALGEAVRDLNEARGGPVPSGELYAAVMGQLTLAQYQAVIDALIKSRMVTSSNNLLTWVGPKGRNYLQDLADWERQNLNKRLAANPNSQDPSKWETPVEEEDEGD